MDAQQLNKQLEIVNLKDYQFATPQGYVKVKGFAFFIKGKGFLKYKSDRNFIPYVPMGGRKSLQSIIDAGGFLWYNDFEFINAI